MWFRLQGLRQRNSWRQKHWRMGTRRALVSCRSHRSGTSRRHHFRPDRRGAIDVFGDAAENCVGARGDVWNRAFGALKTVGLDIWRLVRRQLSESIRGRMTDLIAVDNKKDRTMRPALLAVIIGSLVSASASAGVPSHPETGYSVKTKFALGGEGRWDLLGVDSGSQRVFLSRSDHVDVVNGSSGKRVGTIANTDGVHDIAVVPSLGRGYTSNGKANTLTEFDLKTLKPLREIRLGGQSPDAMAFDAVSGHLFAFNAHSNNVSVVDPVAGKEIALIGFEGNPELAVSDGQGNVFVNIEDKAQLVEIDTRKNLITHTWALAGCEEPTGLAIDVAHQRLFSACANQVMVVTDATSGQQVAKLAIGEGPDGAAFDVASQNAFSPNGRSGTLTVVHEDDPEHFRVSQTLPTKKGARTLGLDAVNHRLYLPTAEFAAKPAEGERRPAMLPDSFTVLVVSH
jgi:DNA-binding beta-propeller fold protein YncE